MKKIKWMNLPTYMMIGAMLFSFISCGSDTTGPVESKQCLQHEEFETVVSNGTEYIKMTIWDDEAYPTGVCKIIRTCWIPAADPTGAAIGIGMCRSGL